MKPIVVIGAGFAGLSAASFLAKAGYQVTVLEKQAGPGGRARQWKTNGFTFDMGPSWYWMPDVFDRYFEQFGKKADDYYTIERLDPSYRVYWQEGYSDIPASLDDFKKMLEEMEPGAAVKLDRFLEEARYKYVVGIQKLVFKPGLSLVEFLDWEVMKGVFKLDVFTSIKKHVHKYFKQPQIRQLLEFPVLFLGALPENTPALYSLMNYADIVGGTWFPRGGMYKVVEGMYKLALELGVQFKFEEPVTSIQIEKNAVRNVVTAKGTYPALAVIGGADYHFIETQLLPEAARSYSEAYWDKREMAPSCLLYYVGINKKLDSILHHMLFFDVPFEQHADEIYTSRIWPETPLFYANASSVTDASLAPEGCENLFFLIPVAAGLSDDSEEKREYYFNLIMDRFEKRVGQTVRDAIVVKRSFAYSDFVSEYHSFKGNAYGLANTLMQTAILKPSCRSKKLSNLYYTGQLTVPGPGVPPSLISGEVVAGELMKSF